MLIRDRMQWQREADVVVVGYGAAGASAAIAASENGAQVLVLEKQPGDRHLPSSGLCGGGFLSPNDAGAAFRFKEAIDAIEGGMSWTDKEVNAAWAEYVSHNKGWIEGLGGKVKLSGTVGEHDVPGTEGMHTYLFQGGARAMMDLLHGSAAGKGAEVLYGTWATRLFTDFTGRVTGVRVTNNDSEAINVNVSRGVVLACGGFEYNENMKLQYLRIYPTYFTGTPAATGEGVTMAVDVGADLWHMTCCPGRVVMKFPGFPMAMMPDLGGRGWIHKQYRDEGAANDRCGFIIVDKRGKRYTRENFKLHTIYYELAAYDSQRMEFPRIPSYAIFDQKRIKAGAIPTRSGATGPSNLYTWSEDNSMEIEKGWIMQADTVRELAQKLGIDPCTLAGTVDLYNSYCRHGADPDFNRHPTDLIEVNDAPFYAIKLWPGGPNTQGGPRRNAKAEIVNADGDPIPGLYGAGELGSVYGFLYTGGGNIAECMAFGRAAGENAARRH